MAATSKAAQVAHARHLLETGQCSTLQDAADQANVSLSTLHRHKVTLAKARAAQAAAPDAASIPSLSDTHRPSNVESWAQPDPATDMGLAPAPAQNADDLKSRVVLLSLSRDTTDKSSLGEQTIRILEATSDLFGAGRINMSTVKSHLENIAADATTVVAAAADHDPDRFTAAVERVNSITGDDWGKQMEKHTAAYGRPHPQPGAQHGAVQSRLLAEHRQTLAAVKYLPMKAGAAKAAELVERLCELAETDGPDSRDVAVAHVGENLDEVNALFKTMHQPGGRMRHRASAATKRFRKVFGGPELLEYRHTA